MTYIKEFAAIREYIKCDFDRTPICVSYKNGFFRYVFFVKFKENPLNNLNTEIPIIERLKRKNCFEFSDYVLKHFNLITPLAGIRRIKPVELFAVMALSETYLFLKSKEVDFKDEKTALRELQNYSLAIITCENINDNIKKSALEIQNKLDEASKNN